MPQGTNVRVFWSFRRSTYLLLKVRAGITGQGVRILAPKLRVAVRVVVRGWRKEYGTVSLVGDKMETVKKNKENK